MNPDWDMPEDITIAYSLPPKGTDKYWGEDDWDYAGPAQEDAKQWFLRKGWEDE